MKEQHIERRNPLCSFFTKLLRSDTLQDFFVVVRSFTADSSLLQPTGCANSTPHKSHFLMFAHWMPRTRVAQVVSLACAHHMPCVISMRSCCVFDSLRLLHFSLFAVYLLSHHPVFPLGHQLHLPRCGGQIPCALSLMRTLALLPRTTLSQDMCEECKTCHDRTGRPFVEGQSNPLFVPSVMKTHIPLTDDPAQPKEDLLQRYKERIEKLSQHDRVSNFCTDAGFLTTVEV